MPIYNPSALATMSYYCNGPLVDMGPFSSAAGTVTANFASSLFMQRINVPMAIKMTEVDVALVMSFAATNSNAGTMSQNFVIYSFGNSTSLASVASVSSSYTWASGTVTVGASTSISQFGGGWAGSNIHPLTFAASSLSPGDYVAAHIVNFAQSVNQSTWTVEWHGYVGNKQSTISGAAVTGLTSASANLVQSVSFATQAITAFTGALTLATALSNAATAAMTINSGSKLSSASVSSPIAVTLAFTAAPTLATVISNSVTAAATHVSTIGSTVSSVLTAAGPAALGSTTMQFQSSTVPAFNYRGTASATAVQLPSAFFAGVMSTGAIPTSIALTSAAVTVLNSNAQMYPWFAIAGS